MGFKHYSPPPVVLPPVPFHRIRESWYFYSQDSPKLSQRQQAPVIEVVLFHYKIIIKRKPQTTSNCGYKDFFPIQEQALTGHLLGWGDHSLIHTERSPLILYSYMLLSTSASAPLRHLKPFHFSFNTAPSAYFPSLDCKIFGSSSPPCSMLSCTGALIHSSKSYGYPHHDLAAHSPRLSSLSDTKWSCAQR